MCEKRYFCTNIFKYYEPETGLFFIGHTGHPYKRPKEMEKEFNTYNNQKFYKELRKLGKKLSDCEFIILKKYWNITKNEIEKEKKNYIMKDNNPELNCNEMTKRFFGLNESYFKKEKIKRVIEEENKEFLNNYREIKNKYFELIKV